MLLKPRPRLRRFPSVRQRPSTRCERRDRARRPSLSRDAVCNTTQGLCVMLPEHGIDLPPNLVGRVVPRPAHVQGQLGQRVESVDLRRQSPYVRWLTRRLIAHGELPPLFRPAAQPGHRATIVRASSRMRRRCSVSTEALRVDPVDVLGPRRTCREPPALGRDLQPADGCIVAGRAREDAPDLLASELGAPDLLR